MVTPRLSAIRVQAVEPPTEAVPEVDPRYPESLGLFDRGVIARRAVATVPQMVGVDVAWLGDAATRDQMVLRHTVNSTSGAIDGLVVPVGAGLGGKVLAARRPLWVSDYCGSQDISPHFKEQVAVEGVKAMMAVPIISGDRLWGVLYGANRADTAFGDRAIRALENIAAHLAAAELVAEDTRRMTEVAVRGERRKVARELRDTVGATLLALRSGIADLAAVPVLDHDIRSRLVDLEWQAVDVVEALGRALLSSGAAPESVSLGGAVRAHCEAFQRRTAIATRLTTLTDVPPMNAARIGALADAVRESLLNVEKHARARSVVATILASVDLVVVTVSDDGIGLPDPAEIERGIGLAAVGEGLARVGGAITIAANGDGGVTVHAQVPL